MKNAIRIGIDIVMMVLIALSVTAIGVSPVLNYVKFEPNLEKEITINIINNEHKDFNALVMLKGDNARYANLNYSLVKVSKDEEMKPFTFRLSLPASIDKPGTHEFEVVVMEFASEKESLQEETIVTSTAAVISKVQIEVPYAGKYAEAKLYVSEANAGEGVEFKMPIYNFGTEAIQSAKARITIYGPTNEVIEEIDSGEIMIESRKEAELKALWKGNANAGKYFAVARIFYDGKEIRLERNFNVGGVSIRILGIKVENFNLGEIAKFDVSLRSDWSEQILNVYGELFVMDKKGNEVGNFKTAPVDIPSLGDAVITGYWNTQGILAGTYDTRVLLDYQGKQTEKVFETKIDLDRIEVVTDQISGEAVLPKSNVKINTILIILVVVLVIVNIRVLMYLRKSKKK